VRERDFVFFLCAVAPLRERRISKPGRAVLLARVKRK
jgi:hypothetical protein